MVNTINISVYEVILIFLMFYIKNCGVCTRDEVESNRAWQLFNLFCINDLIIFPI